MEKRLSCDELWSLGFLGADWRGLVGNWRLGDPKAGADSLSNFVQISEAAGESARWYWAGRGASAAARSGGEEGPTVEGRVKAIKEEGLVDDALSFSEKFSGLEPDAVFGLLCGALGVGSAPMKEIMNLTRETAFSWQEGKMRRLRESIEDSPWDSEVIWALERFGFCGGEAALELTGATRALWERMKLEEALDQAAGQGKAPSLLKEDEAGSGRRSEACPKTPRV